MTQTRTAQLSQHRKLESKRCQDKRNRSHFLRSLRFEPLESRIVLAAFAVNSLNDIDDGACNTAHCSLFEAVSLANTSSEADTIQLPSNGTINLTRPLPLVIGTLDIVGPGASQLTIRRDTGGNYRLLNIDASATVVLSGVTLANGSVNNAPDKFGGAILNAGSLTVRDSVIRDSTAQSTIPGDAGGGGIANRANATLIVERSTITGNSTLGGGSVTPGAGILNFGTATIVDSIVSANNANSGVGGGVMSTSQLTIRRSQVTNNTTNFGGGGVYNDGSGSAEIEDTTISGNRANSSGGGIVNEASLVVRRSTINNNEARNGGVGGGIANFDGASAIIDSSTISTNSVGQPTSGGIGGGIYTDGVLELKHSTVTLNSTRSLGQGGGVYVDSDGTFRATHTILAGNTSTNSDTSAGRDVRGRLISDDYLVIEDTRGVTISGTTTHNILGQPAQLSPLENNGGPTFTHALSAGSPAINAGNPNLSTPPAFDQRGTGYNRVNEGRIDIGAFESGSSVAPLANPDIMVRVAGAASFVGNDIRNSTGENQTVVSDVRVANPVTIEFRIQSDGIASDSFRVTAPNLPTGWTVRFFDAPTGGSEITSAVRGAGWNTPSLSPGNTVTIRAEVGVDATVAANAQIEQLVTARSNFNILLTDVAKMQITNRTTIPATLTVTTTADRDDGTCTTLDCTLREAINAANAAPDANTINFAANVTGTINLSSKLPDLVTDVSIVGPGADVLTVRRDTGGDYRIFLVTADSVAVISGLTITNGNSTTTGAGGGVLNAGGNLTLRDSVVSSNIAFWGGGIGNAGTMIVERSIITGNRGTDSSLGGGGIVNLASGEITLSDSQILDNSTDFFGGGAANHGTMTINRSVVRGNTGSDGGGIRNRAGGTLSVFNSTISGNRANTFGGGGIDTSGQLLLVQSSTIVGNTAQSIGGGGIYGGSGGATLRSTIVANNTIASGSGPDLSGAVTQSSYNFVGIVDGSSGITNGVDQNIAGTAASPRNPQLAEVLLNGQVVAFVPQSGSPVIDQGTTTNTNFTVDQLGNARVVDLAPANAPGGNGADIGAVELTQLSTAPEVAVHFGAQNIDDGDTTPSTNEGSDFGSVMQGAAGVSRTFTVRNDGNATLTLGSVSVPAGFTITEGLSTSIAPGGNDTFTVRIDTATVGTKSGQISFSTNVSGKDPFNFSVQGTVNSNTPTNGPTQRLNSDATTKTILSNTILNIPVLYSTIDVDGNPVALSANLLDVNLHFDSSRLQFLGFVSGREFTEGRVSASQADESTVEGDDGDAATDKVLRSSFFDNDALETPGWPNAVSTDPLSLYIARFQVSDFVGTTTVNFTANAPANVVGQAAEFGFQSASLTVDVVRTTGDVDGNADFDANDTFLTHIAFLGATDTQLNSFKGASPLSVAAIRANIEALRLSGRLDVDGNTATDANDSFLAQLTLLGATDSQINLFKGTSPLTADEIRQRVFSLRPGTGGTSSLAMQPASAALVAGPVSASGATVPAEGEGENGAPVQHVASNATTGNATPGEVLEIPVLYSTRDADGMAAALAANLLDVNLHFDSSRLSFLGFVTGRTFLEGRVAASQVDESTDDGDAATDKVLRSSYFDNDALETPGWPNAVSATPLSLYVARFQVLEFTGSTTINFTRNNPANVVGQAAAFGFEGESLVINVGQTNDLPTLAISPLDAAKDEGNANATDFTFLVMRSGNASGSTTVNYLVDMNGVDAIDFVGNKFPSGTVTFAVGEASKVVTISVLGDTTVEPDETFSVTLSDAVGGIITTASAMGTITNDDVAVAAGVTVTNPTGLTTLRENGTANGSFRAVLTKQPTSSVVVDIQSSDTSEATVSPTQLTFTPQNWSTPQTVNVLGQDDIRGDGDVSGTITISVDDALSDDAFDAFADQTLAFTTLDDDANVLARLTVTETGKTAVFPLVLDTQPNSPVVFQLESSDASEAIVASLTITFTPENWNVRQFVTVRGVDDDELDGTQVSTITIRVDAANSDDAFHALPDRTVPVTTLDDESRASITGSVYADVNNNGLREPSELGIPNVEVKLSGPEERIAFTDSEGQYAFLDLAAGDYTITERQPLAYSDGGERLGTGGGTSGDDFFQVAIQASGRLRGYHFGEGRLRMLFLDLDDQQTFPAGGLDGATLSGSAAGESLAVPFRANSSGTIVIQVGGEATLELYDATFTPVARSVGGELRAELHEGEGYVLSMSGVKTGTQLAVNAAGEGISLQSVPLHNRALKTDVSFDGLTTPLDALIIINLLNAPGSRPAYPSFVDVTGDRNVSPHDVMEVINLLNDLAVTTNGEGETSGSAQFLAPQTLLDSDPSPVESQRPEHTAALSTEIARPLHHIAIQESFCTSLRNVARESSKLDDEFEATLDSIVEELTERWR
jgi:CSLREA domain-containing protein